MKIGKYKLGPKSNHVFLGSSTALLVIHGTSRYHLFPQKLIQAKHEWCPWCQTGMAQYQVNQAGLGVMPFLTVPLHMSTSPSNFFSILVSFFFLATENLGASSRARGHKANPYKMARQRRSPVRHEASQLTKHHRENGRVLSACKNGHRPITAAE